MPITFLPLRQRMKSLNLQPFCLMTVFYNCDFMDPNLRDKRTFDKNIFKQLMVFPLKQIEEI